MDHGLHHLAIYFPFRIWLPSRSDIVAMGIRHRIHIFRFCCVPDHFFHGRNVRLDATHSRSATNFHSFSMYDRTVRPIPEPTTTGFRYRIETLIGITGSKMQKYRVSWTESILNPLRLIWRPHLLMLLIFEVIPHPPQ